MTFEFHRCQIGDCRTILPTLPPDTFQCCVTSPPYWGLRDYGHADQIGHESTPEEYVSALVAVFREVRRALKSDGVLWLNLGDSYAGAPGGYQGKNGQRASRTFTARIDMEKTGAGLKPKDLVGIPWRVAFALQADGWWLRSDVIWSKPNPMPESVSDRPTKAHEYVFLLAKSAEYFFDAEAIAEPVTGGSHGGAKQPSALVGRLAATMQGGKLSSTLGLGWDKPTRHPRSVWTVTSEPYAGAHFATMPAALATRCVQSGSRPGDAVLDPFFGSGTVGEVAEGLGRKWFGCELNPEYSKLIAERTAQTGLDFSKEAG